MDDSRLLPNYHDYWKSLLQDVCFVENFSRFTWARLAALAGGETTAGMFRSDAVRAAHVRSGLMVMMFFGDMKKDAMGAVLRWYRFQCDVLGSSRG